MSYKCTGKLWLVGFGPGDPGNMTGKCIEAIKQADVIVGYSGYVSVLRRVFPDKMYIETGMTREVERCRTAIGIAKEGGDVCVVSGGDSGVYGMAGLVFELCGNETQELDIEVIPGVTAAVGGAALLGAPVGNDFAVISLSDLLTPWSIIKKRLSAAADGDFAICIYNPGSNKRAGHLRIACDILLKTLPGGRICGIAGNIGRQGQYVTLTTLEKLREMCADMSETVFIGNSATKIIGGRMVTTRNWSLTTNFI